MNKKMKEMVLFALGLALVMAVTLWFTDGVMRLILLAVLYFMEVEILAIIQRTVLNEPEKPKMTKEEKIQAEDQWYFDRQDYGKMYQMRRVGVALHVITAVPVVMAMAQMLGRGINPVWGLLCAACSAASIVLCALWPAYFSILHSEKEKNRKHHFPIVNLIVPFISPVFAGICYEYSSGLADWMQLAQIVVIMAGVVGLVLRLLVAECRRNAGQWAVALFFACAVVMCVAMPLNQALEKEEPQIVSGVVTDYDRGGRRSPDKYEITLDNGEEVRIPVDRRFYDYDEGDRIELEYHRGGLGIEYYTYVD